MTREMGLETMCIVVQYWLRALVKVGGCMEPKKKWLEETAINVHRPSQIVDFRPIKRRGGNLQAIQKASIILLSFRLVRRLTASSSTIVENQQTMPEASLGSENLTNTQEYISHDLEASLERSKSKVHGHAPIPGPAHLHRQKSIKITTSRHTHYWIFPGTQLEGVNLNR